MIEIDFLPAKYGDCLWIEYGDDSMKHRILIDGGTARTRYEIRRKLRALPEDQRHFELLIVTHIDNDHIAGILGLLKEDELGFTVDEIWFNGWPHLPGNDIESFSADQGELLSSAILKHGIPWNATFGKKTILAGDSLPQIVLPGGMKLTVLSPATEHLEELKEHWEDEIRKANLVPGYGLEVEEDAEIDEDEESFDVSSFPDVPRLARLPFEEDTSAGNGSSIALLAEYGDKVMLLCGDAFPSQLVLALDKISSGKIKLDLCKISHHASSHNTSPELLQKLDCKQWVVSTNGSIFKHPKEVTIARVLDAVGDGCHLIFNYRSKYNKIWDHHYLKAKYQYMTSYPPEGQEGIKIKV